MKIEIDKDSGFCFGVTAAIHRAEKELEKPQPLFCLGDIVHNDMECQRLSNAGLKTISHKELSFLKPGARVLLRAHGEPPLTYQVAEKGNIELIDTTCPVVLRLQMRIKERYSLIDKNRQQIVIYGQKGHAEVLGLVGQTKGAAIVIDSESDLDKIDFDKDIFLYAQTTKPSDGFQKITDILKEKISNRASLISYNTICGQVSNRREKIWEFADKHDLILFVCGQKSSNGKALFKECVKANLNSHMIENIDQIDKELFKGVRSVGICGATSTPRWLMEECKNEIIKRYNNENKN
ncbi:MAG TPA: 4-hydroxy-3-methylbut-2-enyl diphosphate reductase [Bacteroidaceae bacterium]|nr:4-hydroxy-3-methylbut-2-enyl diphosphate reductase [Bacteroidaceae bacterium]